MPRLILPLILSLTFLPTLRAQETPPLSGPPAQENPSRPRTIGIVDRDLDGRVIKHDRRPEEVAIEKLRLSRAEKAGIDKVLTERAALMDRLVRANFDLLLEGQTLRADPTADPERIANYTARMQRAFSPLIENGTFADQLRTHLSMQNTSLFNDYVNNYYGALCLELMEPTNPPKGTQERRIDFQRRYNEALAIVTTETFGKEVRASYERIAQQGADRLEGLITALELTPEQQQQIRAKAADYAQRTKLNPTPADRIAFFTEISALLTRQQRQNFYDLITTTNP